MTDKSSLKELQVPLFFFNVFIYFWDRDRAWAAEGQREREMQNLKQAPGSELSAQIPTWGSNPQTTRSWPEPKSDAQLTERPRHPKTKILLKAPGWLSWASNFGSGHDLTVRGFKPRVGLCANSTEPGASFRFCVSFSVCPHPSSLSLSLSKINKH